MSSFSKSVAVKLADKYKGESDKVFEKVQANATNNLLNIYRNTVTSVVSSAVDSLSDNLMHGYTGLQPALKYNKRQFPAYQDKYWRYSGKTSVAFRQAKNTFLQKIKNSKASSKALRVVVTPKGKTVTIRLFSGIPEWDDTGMEQLIMGAMTGKKQMVGVPKALRTLYFNEYGVTKRRRGGIHPARPVITPHMERANKVLISRLGRLIK